MSISFPSINCTVTNKIFFAGSMASVVIGILGKVTGDNSGGIFFTSLGGAIFVSAGLRNWYQQRQLSVIKLQTHELEMIEKQFQNIIQSTHVELEEIVLQEDPSNLIAKLCPEILAVIFDYISIPDYLQVSILSKKWHQIAQDSYFLKQQFKKMPFEINIDMPLSLRLLCNRYQYLQKLLKLSKLKLIAEESILNKDFNSNTQLIKGILKTHADQII